MTRTIESVKPSTDGTYIDGADRDGYIDRPMKLINVHREPTAKYGPRWVVEAVMLDSGEKVLIALAANATRDTMFGQVRDDLAADGADAYEPVCLYRAEPVGGGNAFWSFRTATDDEVADADAAAISAESVHEVIERMLDHDRPARLEQGDEAAAAAPKGGKGK